VREKQASISLMSLENFIRDTRLYRIPTFNYFMPTNNQGCSFASKIYKIKNKRPSISAILKLLPSGVQSCSSASETIATCDCLSSSRELAMFRQIVKRVRSNGEYNTKGTLVRSREGNSAPPIRIHSMIRLAAQ